MATTRLRRQRTLRERIAVVGCLLASLSGLPGVAAGAGAPEADAEPLLRQCKRSAVSGGVRFACDGFAASIAEYPLAPTVALRVHVDSLRSIAADVASAEEPFSAMRRKWEGMRFTARRPDGQVAFEGRAAAIEIRAGTTRLVSCGGPGSGPPSACDAVMALLGASGPARWSVAAVDPMFRGRKVPIPKGCRTLNSSETQFRIQCGELAALAFIRLRSLEDLDRFVDTIHDQIVRNTPGAADANPRECRIGGVATRCRVITAGQGLNAASFYLGAAVVDGAPVSVQCFQHAFVKGVHPVCASLVTF